MSKNQESRTSESQLAQLEASLAGTLRRITPRRDFVQRLRGTIRIPPRDEIAMRLRDWQRLILIFSGVVSGLLVMITVARALYHLFGRKQIG